MTLLQLVVKADMFALSLYEGFSVPFSIPQLMPSVELVSVAYSPPFVDVPVLASTLFHPPVHLF
jgi:hypothetical protein